MGNAVGWHGSSSTDGQAQGQVFSVVLRFLGTLRFENACVCLLLSSEHPSHPAGPGMQELQGPVVCAVNLQRDSPAVITV